MSPVTLKTGHHVRIPHSASLPSFLRLERDARLVTEAVRLHTFRFAASRVAGKSFVDTENKGGTWSPLHRRRSSQPGNARKRHIQGQLRRLSPGDGSSQNVALLPFGMTVPGLVGTGPDVCKGLNKVHSDYGKKHLQKVVKNLDTSEVVEQNLFPQK